MRFRDGTLTQRALFAALLGVYLTGALLTVASVGRRVGQPDIGWGGRLLLLALVAVVLLGSLGWLLVS